MIHFILTMIVSLNAVSVTSFSQEYSSAESCEAAKKINRAALTGTASVVLMTCTQK